MACLVCGDGSNLMCDNCAEDYYDLHDDLMDKILVRRLQLKRAKDIAVPTSWSYDIPDAIDTIARIWNYIEANSSGEL